MSIKHIQGGHYSIYCPKLGNWAELCADWKCSHCGELVAKDEQVERNRLVQLRESLESWKASVEMQRKIEAAREKLKEALDLAQNRWCEWGDRAVGVGELLEELERILEDKDGE